MATSTSNGNAAPGKAAKSMSNTADSNNNNYFTLKFTQMVHVFQTIDWLGMIWYY